MELRQKGKAGQSLLSIEKKLAKKKNQAINQKEPLRKASVFDVINKRISDAGILSWITELDGGIISAKYKCIIIVSCLLVADQGPLWVYDAYFF